MIAHVAAAGESRGRVVLRFCAGLPSSTAVSAAFKVAEAFQSEVESLYIEDRELLDLADYPFAVEISLSGRRRRPLSQQTMQSEFLSIFSAARRQIKSISNRCGVPLQERYVRDEPVQALAAACAHSGPWNVIALAEAFTAGSVSTLREMFEAVPDTTGVILAGPYACQRTGPIIVAVEDIERFPSKLRAAERLAVLTDSPVVVLPVAGYTHDLVKLDGEIRLALADRSDVFMATGVATLGEPAVVAEAIRSLRGSFLIARFGGQTVPGHGSLRPLTAVLECPLFLVR